MANNMKINYLSGIWMMVVLSAVLLTAGCSGGNEGDDNPVTVAGAVQKGPFITGTAVIVQVLKDDLNPTGINLNTQITNDFGGFSVTGEVESGYAEIIAKGYYFDEVKGVLSSGEITLRNLSRISSNNAVNINILTTLQAPRIRKLVSEGKSFGDAETQSQKEVLGAFEIECADCPPFGEMNIAEQGDGNAVLLTISAIMQVGRTEAQLSEFTAKVANDIADNGVLDQSDLKNGIIDSALAVDPDKVWENLVNRYEVLGQTDVSVPDFSGHIADYRSNHLDELRFNLRLGYTSSTRASAGGGNVNVPDALGNINDITVIAFDNTGQVLFAHRKETPVLGTDRTYSFGITPQSGGKVFEDAAIYVLVNCPNDYSGFSGTETAFRDEDILINFDSLEEDGMIMTGVVPSGRLTTAEPNDIRVNMGFPFSGVEVMVTFEEDVDADKRTVSSVTLVDALTSGFVFEDRVGAVRTDIALSQTNGVYFGYLFGDSKLRLGIETGNGYYAINIAETASLQDFLPCRRGTLYRFKVCLTGNTADAPRCELTALSLVPPEQSPEL